MLSVTECSMFEKQLAYYASPSLLGIKCAGLFSLEKEKFELKEQVERFNSIVKNRKLKLHVLCSCRKRVLLMLYQEELLAERLQKENDFLQKFGYPENVSVEQALKILAERISESNDFPHEIGIFLDYPKEDVIGFIENRGKNFLFCHYWKVYSNPEKSRQIFAHYDKCREMLCTKLNQGYDIYQALQLF